MSCLLSVLEPRVGHTMDVYDGIPYKVKQRADNFWRYMYTCMYPKNDLACVGDKGNCSVICTLFKIAFLRKWDERGERPFLWPLTSFPDRHTYSVHSVQYRLSSCFEQFCWDLIRTCGFATCCLTDGTSNLLTKWWRLLLAILLFNSFSFLITVQVFTIPPTHGSRDSAHVQWPRMHFQW